MILFFTLTTWAALMLVIWAVVIWSGVPAPRRQGPPPPPAPPPAPPPVPVCGCTHNYAFHDQGTGRCHEYHPTLRYMVTGSPIPCRCRRYTGPVPLPDVFAQELT